MTWLEGTGFPVDVCLDSAEILRSAIEDAVSNPGDDKGSSFETFP
jgi:hypothetical protein